MNEDLQQQLMEFAYGLLDESEADALCERITSDPQVARAYAKVMLQCDLVARAARYDTQSVAWLRPDGVPSSESNVQAASKVNSANTYRRLANWCLGVAASGLICLVGSAYWLSSVAGPNESTSLALVPTTPVHVVVTGPSKLNVEASNPFTVQVESEAGTPVSTTLKYRVYDARGDVSLDDSASTDRSGVVRFGVDPTVARDASRLEITTGDDSLEPMRRELEATGERFVTYLRMDRPLYQPGERVSYRSVTLSRFALRSDREVTVSFEIVNASEAQIAGAANAVETKYGVGSGTFVLPGDLPDGTYTLIARSPNSLFSEEWRDFQVRRYTAPRLNKMLELAQDSYTLGEQVEVDFSVKGVAGKPLADSQLQIQAAVDGVPLAVPQAKTDADGNAKFSLSLPESIERGEANVSVTVQAGDDAAETISKDIPINLGKVNIDFFPEGGELAADLPSRVYFYGRDPLGKPAHMEGRVVDSTDREITTVVTGHEGRGVFAFTPVADEQHRLIIDKPAGVTKEVLLPVASADRFAVIETGAGVFSANAPIAFTLYQRTPPKPLIVAAYCRGAMVAQQTFDADTYTVDQSKVAALRGELSLPAPAQGVIRLTVFDAAQTPPEPLAERLVYRRIGQKLDVRLTPSAESFTPGQPSQFDVQVRDENDAPIPAVLGISVVDDAIMNLADDESTRMPAYFHLLTEIDSPEQLEDANFYLSDKPESAAALDSLLGTQGWRRFRELPEAQLAQAGGGGFGGAGYDHSFRLNSRYHAVFSVEEASVPISTEATMDLRRNAQQQPARSANDTSSGRTSLAFPIIVTSAVLLVLVGVASLRRTHGHRSLRVFAAVVAVGSLVVGVLSLPMKSDRMNVGSDYAVPSASREVATLSDESMAASAMGDVESLSEPLEGMANDRFMFKPDDAVRFSETPPADAAPFGAEASDQLEAPPQEAERFTMPRQRLGRETDAIAGAKAGDLAPSKDTKEAMPSEAARPLAAAAPMPSDPQPAAQTFEKQDMRSDDLFEKLAAKKPRRVLAREYTPWFFETRPNSQPTDQSSTTIFWVPLFMADEKGEAAVYFNLPQHESSFRAIVEAHGADRLGAGELLIESRQP